MAIVKKPESRPAAEAEAEKFIAGAGAPKPSATPQDAKRKPVMIRCKPAILAQLDAAATKRGMTRSALIQYALSEFLEREGQ